MINRKIIKIKTKMIFITKIPLTLHYDNATLFRT